MLKTNYNLITVRINQPEKFIEFVELYFPSSLTIILPAH
ncbi:hypothetical protein ABIB50_000024 [Mucilaginibacter sp. UYCu711]